MVLTLCNSFSDNCAVAELVVVRWEEFVWVCLCCTMLYWPEEISICLLFQEVTHWEFQERCLKVIERFNFFVDNDNCTMSASLKRT